MASRLALLESRMRPWRLGISCLSSCGAQATCCLENSAASKSREGGKDLMYTRIDSFILNLLFCGLWAGVILAFVHVARSLFGRSSADDPSRRIGQEADLVAKTSVGANASHPQAGFSRR
jgi:hypothetical protein